MARTIVRVYAERKSLDQIEIEIRRGLVHANTVQVEWTYIADSIIDKPNGDKEAVVMWADTTFPKRWAFLNDDIVVAQE